MMLQGKYPTIVQQKKPSPITQFFFEIKTEIVLPIRLYRVVK